MSTYSGGFTTTGYYKIIDNLVEVTQVITGINYTAPGAVGSNAQHVGFVELDIPVGPAISPISGTATWFGPLLNPAVPGQVTFNNGTFEVNQVCVVGTVFPLAGGSPSIAYATIGGFRMQEIFANPPTPIAYQNGALVVKYEYLM